MGTMFENVIMSWKKNRRETQFAKAY